MSQPVHEQRGKLTRQTSVSDFRSFYWLKVELEQFCREVGLSTAGGKREIAHRIEHFLGTGQRLAPPLPLLEPRQAQAINNATVKELSLETRVPVGFRCTQELREFFVRQLGERFHFSVTLQQYIKEHPGVTLGEIAEEWKRQDAARRVGALRPAISPQFEYNQFTRDYFADPRNQGKSRQDCREAWKRTRDRRGDNKYRPDEP